MIAWQGNAEEAAGLIEEATAEGVSRGEGRILWLTGYVGAVLYNGLGRYEEAFAAARQACEYEDFGVHGFCLIELVEAATRAGEREAATNAVRRLKNAPAPAEPTGDWVRWRGAGTARR